VGVLRRRAVVIGVVVVVVAGAAGAGWVVLNRKPALPSQEVAAYLQAWERFDVETMQLLTAGAPPEMVDAVAAMRDDLRVTAARFKRVDLRREGEGAIASYAAEVDLAGLGTWAYDGTLEFRRPDGKWRLVWSPTALHPALGAGERFGRTRAWPVRAPITGADSAPLVAAGDVVDIGLQPERIRDLAQVQAVLRQQVGVEPAAVSAALNAPGVRPDHFVAVARIRPDRFAQVRPVLEPVPGVFFQRTTGRLPVAENFALHVLGRYDEVTAERL
jgi:hypothetical protein